MRTIMIVLLLTAGIQLGFSIKSPILILGTVTDQSGNAIAGVSIVIKGTTTATTSDANGNFSISVPSLQTVLVISGVGFETTEVKIKNQKALSIKLKFSRTALDEVVVIGYGGRSESDYPGANAKIAAPELESNSINYVLQGRVAGVSGSRKKSESQYYSFNDSQKKSYESEQYENIVENRFMKALDQPLSTFSIDVDAASYSNLRRFVNNGQIPPPDAVRIEELVNYFSYNYSQPSGEDPFAVHTEVAASPWHKNHQLVMVGLQGKKIPVESLPPSNLVFLIDVSGSMQDANKLPLVKASMNLLVDQLRKEDHVSMVVYAGAAGLVLPPTSGVEKEKIREAIDRLEAGGSTAGSAGIKLAYSTAKSQFLKEGNNRVILCTDGDFNVGVSSDEALEKMIEEERKSGVFLTVLGFGMGNYQDAKMQKLADKGNGNHAYIDQLNEAKKVLVNEFGGTLFTIAKDVKLQVEFNPALVKAYRLVGYENRMLNKEDFNNDKKDAGDMGSGHTVTALYEIIPTGVNSAYIDSVDVLKYQSTKTETAQAGANSNELMTVKIRYKQPAGDKSKLLVHTVNKTSKGWEQASENFRFASAVAGYGMLVRNSEFKGNVTYNRLLKMIKSSIGTDEQGYRREFKNIVENTASLARKTSDIEEEDLSSGW
jgi:Ca-activated chloride channel family protein